MNYSQPILFKQVRLIDPSTKRDCITDVLIAESLVQVIKTFIKHYPRNTKVIDAKGLVLAPGLVDLYSYSGEPGHEERETIFSLMKAAAAGGFTRLAILPNTLPSLDCAELVISLQQKIQQTANYFTKDTAPQLYIWGALTKQNEGKHMTEIASFLPNILGFASESCPKDLDLLRQILTYLRPFNKPIALNVSNSTLRRNGVMREGAASIRYGLPSDSALSESVTLAAVLEMVRTIGTPVHIMRLSTCRGVELIADAKARGVPVTASVTWMHLLFNTEDINKYNCNLRLEPPIGNPEDMEALIDGVQQGVIDAIAVDHTPHTYEEKTLGFADALPGAIGLELMLPLLWNRFVASGQWSALKLWQAISTNPLLCLQQKPIDCFSGKKVELVLFDPQSSWSVKQQFLNSLASNTPWYNQEITGKVVRIWNS